MNNFSEIMKNYEGGSVDEPIVDYSDNIELTKSEK